jgi:putative CocE/NonD family hydrolase
LFVCRQAWCITVAVAAAAAASLGAIAQGQQDRSAIAAERNVPVVMRDGTVLRANVFRPAGEGPFPVLVMRTPYGKPAKADEDLVQAGFIVVTQDARGRFASDGNYESFVRDETHDAVDGYDTVEWAARLPGSTGKVGMFGASYNAFLQWRAASRQPPSLSAIAAFSIPARYPDLEGPGTIRPGRRLKWWHGTISPDLRRKLGQEPPHTSAAAAAEWNSGEGERLLGFLPWLELPDHLFSSEAGPVKSWLREPWRDPWKLASDAARTTVPNLNVCGWYDHCNGSIDLHTAIAETGASELARGKSKLLIGPWSHSALGRRKQGQIDFGPAAQVDLVQLQAEWFRHWLKQQDQAGGVSEWPAVKLFVMGSGQWRSFNEWPPKEAAAREFFLSSTRSARTPAGDGRLTDEPPAKSGTDSYSYDPRDPVPALWTKQYFTVPADQTPLADRQDILVYQTEKLTADVETIGYPEVVLNASSSCPDTDFFVRLIDVEPSGRAIDITSGMIRARFRGGLEKPVLLTPGERTEFRLRLRPTAHRFLPGHRIRLDVTSSDFPNYDRNHNTAADQNADAELATAKQTIYFGGAGASRLRLPVMPIADASGR